MVLDLQTIFFLKQGLEINLLRLIPHFLQKRLGIFHLSRHLVIDKAEQSILSQQVKATQTIIYFKIKHPDLILAISFRAHQWEDRHLSLSFQLRFHLKNRIYFHRRIGLPTYSPRSLLNKKVYLLANLGKIKQNHFFKQNPHQMYFKINPPVLLIRSSGLIRKKIK